MTLGQRIQELRKQRGMSQEALGDALGVSRQAVSKWEGDNGIPELDTLIAMSRLFEVTVGQLLGVEEPVEQKSETANESEENKEDLIAQRIKLKLVIHGDLAKLRNIKGSQTSTAAYQDAFCGFARSQGILLVLSDGKVVRFSCFQFFKHAVNGVLVWSLGRQGSTGFHRRRTP